MEAEVELGGVINTSPRPRMLILGFGDEPELVKSLLKLCPTVKYIESMGQVRQAEWDLLVTDRELADVTSSGTWLRVDPHLSVIYRASNKAFRDYVEARGNWSSRIVSRSGMVSREIRRVRGLPDRIERLVHESLEPVLFERESHGYFTTLAGRGNEGSPAILPFIVTADGSILAGRYRRSESSETWMLPSDVRDLSEWVHAALGEWHALAPDRFPGIPDWAEAETWMTAEEVRFSSEISEVRRRRVDEMAKFDALERELQEHLAAARSRADAYERALLTSQSDELKESVQMALRDLGFDVVDADLSAASDDHLEDLHVMDPDVPDWLGLGEVKGYLKGAKTEGLTQFLRFNMRYMQKHGRVPDSCWYIVNQFAKRDPSRRQLVLNGKDEDVRAFGAAGGLVIDTVELFKLLRAVSEDRLAAADARKLLRESTGRFRVRV
ncbi:hypothetical protein [Streptomyces sp. NPDC085479]|uniref:hypothetical protein n=1 Tax=Streptomyces sp. NPDC085479 TaxID=3365726 RepID=UPI0037D71C09